MNRALIPCLFVLLAGCAHQAARTEPAGHSFRLADDIELRQLAPGVWMHTSIGDGSFAGIPANGLLIEDGSGSVLIDGGWNSVQAARLLRWAREEWGHPVRVAIATHFHLDRTGSIPALVEAGIPVYALSKTVELAKARGMPVPTQSFEGDSLRLGPVELFYPGPGHAPDNIVVWHRDSRVLYGGCWAKEAHAPNLGNLSDANLGSWPKGIAVVRARYPELHVVVPGHGEPGGPELLTHTEALLAEPRR